MSGPFFENEPGPQYDDLRRYLRVDYVGNNEDYFCKVSSTLKHPLNIEPFQFIREK